MVKIKSRYRLIFIRALYFKCKYVIRFIRLLFTLFLFCLNDAFVHNKFSRSIFILCVTAGWFFQNVSYLNFNFVESNFYVIFCFSSSFQGRWAGDFSNGGAGGGCSCATSVARI